MLLVIFLHPIISLERWSGIYLVPVATFQSSERCTHKLIETSYKSHTSQYRSSNIPYFYSVWWHSYSVLASVELSAWYRSGSRMRSCSGFLLELTSWKLAMGTHLLSRNRLTLVSLVISVFYWMYTAPRMLEISLYITCPSRPEWKSCSKNLRSYIH